MGVPVAVASSTKTPGFYLKVDLTAGASSPGSASKRALIVSPKSSAGSLVADTQLKQAVAGKDDAKTLWGPGTPGHLAATALFDRYGQALVDGIAPAAGGGVAASGRFDFSGVPTTDTTYRITINAVRVEVTWVVGETANQMRDKAILAINAQTDFVPVTAASDGNAGRVLLNAKFGGRWGNDVRFTVEIVSGAGGALSNITAMANGTLEANLTNVLALLVTARQYDIIVLCTSNADAEDNSGSSEVSRLKTWINQYNVGLQAKLQTVVYGATSALMSSLTPGSIKINDGPFELVYAMNAQELGCMWAGFEAGDRLKREALEFGNPNRIGTVYSGFKGAFDKTADKPTPSEVEAALNAGLAIIDYNASGDAYIVAPITTHSQDTSGNPDSRIYYVTEVTGAYTVANDLKIALPQEYTQVKITKDQAPSADPLPPNTVEERDVKATVIGRCRFFQRKGTIRQDKLNEAIANGTLIVVVDESDASQVNIVLPVSIVKPLAKMGAVVQKNA